MATGTFGYFKFTISGRDLKGDYMNRSTPGLQDEQGTKTIGDDDVFSGTYNTNWTESSENREAVLVITNGANNTFNLRWEVTNGGGAIFRGRGVIETQISQNVLVGFYDMLP